MRLRKTSQLTVLFLFTILMGLPGLALAFDHLEITVVNPQMVNGRPAVTVEVPFSVRVRAVNANGSTDATADFINAQLYTNDVTAVLPASSYLSNGERQFDNLRFLAEGQPIRLRVRDADDGSVPHGEILIDCYNYVDRFNISVPAGPKFVDQAINITFTAVDVNGATVLNFRDDVTLSALVGDFDVGPTMTITGPSFNLGAVTMPVVFWGTDPLTRENTLDAVNSIQYPGQAAFARGSAVISPLRPGPLADVILLLPGETLTPGISPGKVGTPTPQISGNPFNGVEVYATDQHWNPVESSPYPNLAWNVDDTSPGVSLPPAGGMAGSSLLNQSITLIQSGVRRVTVNASGPVSATSFSDVTLNPEGLDHFVFEYAVWDTNAVQVTTIPFNLRVYAEDINNNPFPYNGQVTIRALLGTSDESEDYIVINTTTFVNGQLDALVQVTKRAFSARVIVDSNANVVGTSGSFQVNSGPLDRVLLTFPGETWTPGLNDTNFSGNLGSPNSTIAGLTVTPVTVRPVDRYANIVSGQRNVTMTSPTGYFELPDYPNNFISLNNPVDIRVIMRTHQDQVLTADASGVNPNNSSPIFVSPAGYARMAVEAPGEQLDPGIFDTLEDDGKVGNPATQDAGVPFNVRVYAVDPYWNPVTDVDPALPISVDFSSSDPLANLPNNPQSLPDNSADFQVTLITLADPNQQTIRVDDNGSSVFAFTTIPIKAGQVDHFDIGVNNRTNPTPADVLSPIPDHQAGSFLPNVTIVARDIFNNHIAGYTDSVTMYVDHGTGILTPTRVSMGDGFGLGAYQGAWRGNIQISKSGQGVHLFVREETFGTTDSSNAFDVFSGTYGDLVLLLPGETQTPGIAPGKVGTPLPVRAGDPVQAIVVATDAFWNPVAAQPAVHFQSNSYFGMISLNDQPLDPDGTGTFDMFFKTATTHDLSVNDLILPAQADISTILVTSADFDRLMILAPGEVAEPGGPQADGKIGTPNPQIASIEFNMRIRSVDQFWNQVDNSTEHVHLDTDDGSVTPTNPLNNDAQLVNGEITMPIFLTSTGFVTLASSALDNTDITGQQVTVEIQQGATYQITTPPTANVGPPNTFSMSIALVDSQGIPVPDANNWVDVKAMLSNLEPASSVLQITQAQLQAGSITISTQAYDTVEEIVIQISDTSGRVSYSNPIQMLANGLEYVVTVGTSPQPVVGPPATFPVTVQLRDNQTFTTIDDDRLFSVAVMTPLGAPGVGAVGTTSMRLDRGQITFQQTYTKAENVFISVMDSTGLSGSSPVFQILNDGYKKLQIVAPGEIVEAGDPNYSTTGKSSTPLNQRSGELFPITVRAVDQFWNLADTTSVGSLRLVASDNSFSLPGNPQQNNVPFINGRRTFNGFLVDQGLVTVNVFDEADIAKPSQAVDIPVDPPYEYEITVPATASTGPVPGFQVVVKLIDPVTGNVVPTAQNPFTLTPLRPNQGAASGVLGLTQAQLVGGVSVINNQSYSTVEDIIIRVSDTFGREQFSSVIVMDTGGLFYSVSIPDTAIVGPPETFDVDIELIDGNTGQRVTTQDRIFDIQVLSASTGLAGTGVLEVRTGLLAAGQRTIAEAYTLAEDIFIQISDSTGVTGISNTCRMLTDGFKRIQLIAPGETAAPGSIVGQGKTGAPLTQQAEAPFTLTVRAVDQYWNLVNTIIDGQIELSSTGSLNLVDPVDAGAPFVNGSRDIQIILGDPGTVTVFGSDPTRPTVIAGQVSIPVNEAEYQIVLPTPPVVTAGPPATWPLTVRLVNPDTGMRINAGNDFTMTALAPDRSPARNTLGITQSTLVAGEAIIGGQTYATSEDIVIMVTDARGRTAYSEVLTIVPVGVQYSFDVPDTVVAGTPWEMSVLRVDIVTGELVTSDDRTFTLRAFSGSDPRPDWNLTPPGILADSVGTTIDGTRTFTAQNYDRAEPIFLRVADSMGDQAFSNVITVLPAPVTDLALWAEDLPGQPLTRPLRPTQQATLIARATDFSGNPVIGHDLTFRVLSGDGRLTAGQQMSYSTTTGVNGQAVVDFRVLAFGRVDGLVDVASGNLQSPQVLIDIIGPPLTTITFNPPASQFGDGFYVSSTTEIYLAAQTEDPGGINVVKADIEANGLPTTTRPPGTFFTPSGEGFSTPGAYTLSFFAEENSGVSEALQSVQLYLSTPMETDKEITNRPNPFNAGQEPTVILFRPTNSGTVTVTMYTLYGDVVFSDQMPVSAGNTEQYIWDGRNGNGRVVANGGYICRIFGSGIDYRRKIAVVK